jgi:glycine cleavage system pyridoxal-binding protein P
MPGRIMEFKMLMVTALYVYKHVKQHIKREKQLQNILHCSGIAVMAGMFAVYHGPKGLKYIRTKYILLLQR